MVTSCQLRTVWRGQGLLGFQLAAGQHFDLIGAALGDGVIPLTDCNMGNSKSFGCRRNGAEVL
ncbi:hypothetical protein D3C72_2560810 [compost metagenome]